MSQTFDSVGMTVEFCLQLGRYSKSSNRVVCSCNSGLIGSILASFLDEIRRFPGNRLLATLHLAIPSS